MKMGNTTSKLMTLSEARALECNGCGDCCGSKRNESTMGWGQLPPDQYRSHNGGEPLIIPLNETTLKPRPWSHRDKNNNNSKDVLFECAAFCPNSDGTGSCTIHETRPERCQDFPVFSNDMEECVEIAGEFGDHGANLLPRCTWFNVLIVTDDHPLLDLRQDDGFIRKEDITRSKQARWKQWRDKFQFFRGKMPKHIGTKKILGKTGEHSGNHAISPLHGHH